MRRLLVLLFLTLLVGCTQHIKDIKSDEYVGESVSVKGTVENTLKIGSISGYTLRDAEGEGIIVASNELPAEGSEKRVSGTLRKTLLLGYYIES